MEFTNIYIPLRDPATKILECGVDEARRRIEAVMPNAPISVTASSRLVKDDAPPSPIIRVGISYTDDQDLREKAGVLKKLFNREKLMVSDFV